MTDAAGTTSPSSPSSSGATPTSPTPPPAWQAVPPLVLAWATRMVGLLLLVRESLGAHDALTLVIAGAMVGVGEVVVESLRGRR